MAVSTPHYVRTEVIQVVQALNCHDTYQLLHHLAAQHPNTVMDCLADMRRLDAMRHHPATSRTRRPSASPAAQMVAADTDLRNRGAL